MVVYIEMDGNVKILSPENLYQGSTTNRVTLITPFPSTTAVSVGFILPDGTTVTDSSGANYFPMKRLNTETSAGVTATAYEYVLPFTVLEQYGELKIAFKATFANGNQTSYLAAVEVQESILPTPPENPDEDTYQLLLQYIQTAMQNATNAQSAAEAAQTAAESAETKAAAAETTANQAKTTAEGIDGKATEALGNSEQAVTTANQAKTTADGIDGKATEALGNSEQAITTANEAKELAEQAVAGAGTEVYVDNALQPRMDFTSDPQTQINDKQTQIDNIEKGTTQVGSAAQADKLAQTRNLKVDLASGEAQSFDGSANAEDIGVDGVLPVANGGTGATSLENIKVGRATADGSGNVIENTYAKLAQVVRTDVVSSNSDEQKRIASENILRYITGSSVSAGWYRVAKLSDQGIYEINVSSNYNINAPVAIKFIVAVSTSSGYNTSITQIGGAPNLTVISQARLNQESGSLYFEIYVTNPNNSIGVSCKAVTSLGSGLSISNITPVAFTNIASPSNVIAAIKVVCGINTTGNVYQNGSPVLVGSAPTWVTGTSGSLTLPSAGWYIISTLPLTVLTMYSGIIYWNGDTTNSRYSLPTTGSNEYCTITSGGTITVPSSNTSDDTVRYCKLA